MAWIMTGTMVLTVLSSIMLLLLLGVYGKNLKRMPAKFTLGLFIFALVWLIEKLVSLYYYVTMMEYYVPEVSMQVFLLTLLQTLALMILLKITWE